MDLQLVKTTLNFNEIFVRFKQEITEAAVHEVLQRLSRGLLVPSQQPVGTSETRQGLSPKTRKQSRHSKSEKESKDSFECLLGCGKRFTSMLKHGYHLRGCNKKYRMDYRKQIKSFFGTTCACGAQASHLVFRHDSLRSRGFSGSRRVYIGALLGIRDRGEAWAKQEFIWLCRRCSAVRASKRRRSEKQAA